MLKTYFIKINNLEWKVTEVESSDRRLVIDEIQRAGVCCPYTLDIFIDKNLVNDLKEETLRHELTHAYLFTYLLEKKESFTEEEMCEFVAKYSKGINKETERIIRELEVDNK